MYRNGNPLDSNKVLWVNAVGEAVKNWWRNIYGRDSTAMEQFEEVIQGELLNAEKLYSMRRTEFIPST